MFIVLHRDREGSPTRRNRDQEVSPTGMSLALRQGGRDVFFARRALLSDEALHARRAGGCPRQGFAEKLEWAPRFSIGIRPPPKGG